MIKKFVIITMIVSTLLLSSCVSKKILVEEQTKLERSFMSADSLIYDSLFVQGSQKDMEQDAIMADMQIDRDTSFFQLMQELGRKNARIDTLTLQLTDQANFIDSISATLDTLQSLRSGFKDADYSLFDLAKLKGVLDSLTVNQKHLSRELQYMIRDINLIERNMMDIMNYSNNSIKSQMRVSDLNVKRSVYRNNSKAMQMIMVYLMTRSSAQPEEFLSYIDSVYALGDRLDTVQVNLPGRSDSILEIPEAEETVVTRDSLMVPDSTYHDAEADTLENISKPDSLNSLEPDSVKKAAQAVKRFTKNEKISDQMTGDSLVLDSLVIYQETDSLFNDSSSVDTILVIAADSTQNSSVPAPK